MRWLAVLLILVGLVGSLENAQASGGAGHARSVSSGIAGIDSLTLDFRKERELGSVFFTEDRFVFYRASHQDHVSADFAAQNVTKANGVIRLVANGVDLSPGEGAPPLKGETAVIGLVQSGVRHCDCYGRSNIKATARSFATVFDEKRPLNGVVALDKADAFHVDIGARNVPVIVSSGSDGVSASHPELVGGGPERPSKQRNKSRCCCSNDAGATVSEPIVDRDEESAKAGITLAAILFCILGIAAVISSDINRHKKYGKEN